MRGWILYFVCLALLTGGGLWEHLAAAGDRARIERAARQLREVRGLLDRVPLDRSEDESASLEELSARSIGISVQDAAARSGLERGSIEQVTGARHGRDGAAGVTAAYGVRVKGVRLDGLVHFIYVLDADMGLATARAELTRRADGSGRWDAFLSIVRTI